VLWSRLKYILKLHIVQFILIIDSDVIILNKDPFIELELGMLLNVNLMPGLFLVFEL